MSASDNAQNVLKVAERAAEKFNGLVDAELAAMSEPEFVEDFPMEETDEQKEACDRSEVAKD